MGYAETEPFWNTQLNVREVVPDFAAWQDRHEALSAEADRHGVATRVATLGDPATALWSVATGRKTHVLVFVNGTDWQTNNASTSTFVTETAVAANATLAIAEYRTMPAVRMAEAVADVVAAVETVQLRSERTVLVGSCSGAHLALEASLRCARAPAAVIAVSGVYDLAPFRYATVGAEIGLTREEAEAFSPITRADAIRCPLHIFAGADETVEYRRQAARMFEAVRDAGKAATLTFVLRRHHASAVADLANPASTLSRTVQRLLV